MTTRVSNNGEAAVSPQNTPNTQKKYSPVFHNWRCNVRSSRKMQIVLTILHMVAAPAIMLASIISIYSNNEIDGAAAYAVIGAITTCIAGFMGIFTAVDSFKCLYSRSVVDMRLSLPLTADQRFVSNFLSGLFTYLAPFLASQVISLILAGYGLLFMEGKTFYRYIYDYDAYGKQKLEPYVCDYFSQITPALLKLILCGILVMLMLYSLTVLVTVCCGSKFECIAYSIIINAVIPLTILMVTMSMFNNIFGVNPENNAVKIFLLTSPAGGIFAAIGWVDDYGFMDDYMHPAVWAAVFLLVTAAFAAGAFFLYRKRRAEQVSKPFVFKLLYYIILTGGIFCLFSLFAIAEISLIPTIITTAIVYMIFEVVTNRGFRKFWLSGIKYAATMVSAFLLIFVAQKTDGFGALWRVPAAGMVTEVEIWYDGFYGDFNFVNTVTIKDRQNIEAIIAAHKNVLDNYKEFHSLSSDHEYLSYYESKKIYVNDEVTVKYKLAGGGTIERSYDRYITPSTMELLSVIDLSDEFKTQAAENCRTSIINSRDSFESRMAYNKEKNRTDHLGDTAVLTNALGAKIFGNNSEISMYYLYNHNFFEQLAEAYANDIMAINEENYYRSEIPEQYTLSCRGIMLNIPGSFENTLRLLAAYDFYIPKNEDVSDAEIDARLLGTEVTMFSEREWREITEVDENSVLHARYSAYPVLRNIDEYRYFLYDFDEEIIDIFRHAQPRNIVGKNSYTINVSGTSYVIPAEMQIAAERAAAGRTPYDKKKSERNSKVLEQLRQIANGASDYYYY